MCEKHQEPLGFWSTFGWLCIYVSILAVIVARIEGVDIDDGHDHSGEVPEDHVHVAVHGHETFHEHETSECRGHAH